MTRDQQDAVASAKDDQKCLSYGARPGTDAYVNCCTHLDSARTTAEVIEDAAPNAPINPGPVAVGCTQASADGNSRSSLYVTGLLSHALQAR
jgi:hypothetical protein